MRGFLVAAIVLLGVGAMPASGGPMDLAADYLVANQNVSGHWGEAAFVGESTIGLCHAYQKLGGSSYRDAAVDAGNYILSSVGYDAGAGTYSLPFYASECWAIACVHQITGTNSWGTALEDFFAMVRTGANGMQGFVDGIVNNYGSGQQGTAVYDLCRFCAAAGHVSDADVGVWRSSIINLLGDIDEYDDASTLAVAAAVWALELTGSLDGTVLSGSSAILNGMTLSQLPGLLVSLQWVDGSFAWGIDGSYPGYTEPTALATLALNTTGGYDTEVAGGSDALGGGVAGSGACYFEIGFSVSGSGFYYSGETLEGMILAPVGGFERGDANADGSVQLADVTFILGYLFDGGTTPSCLDAADANDDGSLDISDAMKLLIYLFGEGAQPPAPFGACGEDPTADALDCADFAPCS